MRKGKDVRKKIKKIRGSLLSVCPWQTPNSQLMSLMTQKQGEEEANKQNRKKHFQSTLDVSFLMIFSDSFEVQEEIPNTNIE